MFRALGCLALAMTGCAALLAWMRPQAALTDPDTVREQASQAVTLDGAVRLRAWRSVEIAAPVLPTAGMSHRLAAVAQPVAHFIISDRGLIRPQERWTRQQTDRAGVIVVALDGGGQGEAMPVGQWIALRSLLRALESLTQAENAPLPVVLCASQNQADSEWTRALTAWLSYEGFSLSVAGGMIRGH